MAILAAAGGRKVADVAGAMVRIREVIDPRPHRAGRFREPYLRLVDELARRGWVAATLAQHAHRKGPRDTHFSRPARCDCLARREPLCWHDRRGIGHGRLYPGRALAPLGCPMPDWSRSGARLKSRA